MSLNQLTLVDSKFWLNLHANNLTIDGNLSVMEARENYALVYQGFNEVKFAPLENIQLIGTDLFNIQPVINAAPSRVLFEVSAVTPDNFSINGDNNIVCETSGYYYIAIKVVEAGGTNTSRPRLVMAVNATQNLLFTLNVPLCTPQTIQNNSGVQIGRCVQLVAGDIVSLNLFVQPAGNISLMNVTGASNIVLVKLT